MGVGFLFPWHLVPVQHTLKKQENRPRVGGGVAVGRGLSLWNAWDGKLLCHMQ